MNVFISFGGVFLFAVMIFVLNRKRDADEKGLPLKLAGYYMLAIFNFNLGGVMLPVGFILSLFLKPTANTRVKRVASLIGLIVILIFYFFQ